MIQHSRKPALAVLGAACVAAAAYLANGETGPRDGSKPTLAQLELSIADPDASNETWLLYAQCLQRERRFAHAAMAYTHVLEKDPYRRTANLQCGIALALAGDADRFHEFVSNLVLLEPRLALDVLGRPEAQTYLSAERFQTQLKRAQVQSMD